MERKLIDYLPIFIQEYGEIAALMDAEQVNVEGAWTSAENIMKDQFVTEATENGVKRWESILGVAPKATYTVDERKFNILARLNEQLPYTMESLKTALSSLCGEGGYALKMDSGDYSLVIKLALDNENNITAVSELLSKMIPANIVRNITIFNAHLNLKDYTHEYLSTYTHEQLRVNIL